MSTKNGQNYVVVGAGPAGVVAAEALRKTDPTGKITLIGDEPEPPYSRMALPYYLIDRISEDGTHLRHDHDHYTNLGIEVQNARVSGLDRSARVLHLENGSTYPYDKLLFATGASPIKLPIPGMDLEGVINCWTLEDGRRIAARTQPGAKVILVGAGFIGCIVLEALVESGVDLSVVEMGDRMVPRMLNPVAGSMLKKWCQSKGVAVYTSTKITAISQGNGPHPLQATLEENNSSTQRILDADLVITAAGVSSNIGFLKNSGIETDHGILVNEYFQSNDPDIHAAGDCAQGRDFSTGEFSVHAIQPTAVEHGRIAALNMAGSPIPYRGSLNMNVLDTLGLVSSSFGLWMGSDGGDSAELVDEKNFRYINLQFEEDQVIGAQSLGWTDHIGVLRGLIQTGLRLGQWKDHLKNDPMRVMEAYLGATQSPVGT